MEINKVGFIRTGDEAGKYVRVEELPDSPPSYLILLAHDREFKNGCGDYWAEDYPSLEGFFSEGNWAVGWHEAGNS
ncbi:hypothetical protein [Streptomyces sp. NPDC059009]|uniref:hypothetical protein n=1 Tax=Streptomyces sp. NPDC059009 TaxID=3346694 RepID=UPI0036C862EC